MQRAQGAEYPAGVEASLRSDPRSVRTLAADVIALLADPASPTVLEICGAESSLIDRFGEANVHRVDVAETAASFARQGGGRLAHPDDSFDYAVGLEMIGQLPEEARNGVLEELRRVSRHGIVVALPAHRDGEGADDPPTEVAAALERSGDHVLTLEADWAALVVATGEDVSGLLRPGASTKSRSAEERGIAATALSAIRSLSSELSERRLELRERERELTEARAGLRRKEAQLGDLSNRLGDALVVAADERRERLRLEARIDAIEATRAWRAARSVQRGGRRMALAARRFVYLLASPFRKLARRARG